MKHEENGDDETTRSGLFFEAIRIIKEMRNNVGTDNNVRLPRFGLLENVPGLLSSNDGEDFRVVLEEMARVAEDGFHVPYYEQGGWSNAGTIIGNNFSIAWRIHDSRYWGTPQRRKRLAVLADFNGLLAPEIMFERDSGGASGSEVQSVSESLSGDSSESGSEGQDSENAGDSREGTGETGGSYTFRNHFDGRVIKEQSLCLDTCVGGGIDSPCSSMSEARDKVYGFPLYFRPENTRCYEETATTVCNGTRPGYTNGVLKTEG
jgi:site-specific DNA-cytosine methylase